MSCKNDQSKPLVIIADDDVTLATMLAEMLNVEGIETRVVHNGEDVLKHALECEPDLILLDVMMPKMTGIEALGELRKTPWGAQARVVLLTNVNEPDAYGSAMEAGKGELTYLVKTDWSLEEVIGRIKSILSERPNPS